MFIRLPAALLILIVCAPLLAQTNVVCTADVPPATCKAYSVNMDWSHVDPWLKGVEVVIADPQSFKVEEKRIDDIIQSRVKTSKTVWDINKAGGLKVGTGVFTNVFMETDGYMIKKIVVSTDRRVIVKSSDGKDIVVSDEDDSDKLSDELLYYVIGFYQGVTNRQRSIAPPS